ncbi:Neogenin (Fragment) [Geodia barretti]|uniref:Neogenin n=1 Tax=Geodia barretti TaxID=519541 RepID=A0AA35SD03_GEOBA
MVLIVEIGISLMELDCHSQRLMSDVYETRIAEGVELRRWNPSTTSPPSGIYRCDIPTNAVHDDTDISVRDTVYVGVYTASGGSITINVGILRNGNILTCISTGGPATTVTWTRDSTTITQGTETVLVDPVTAQYNHTLHVVGSSRGSYTCTVSNNKPSSASASIDIRGTSLNVILGLPTIGATWIYLPWEISELDENLYSIVWDGNPSVRCPGVGGGREDSIRNTLGSYNITGLEEDSRYIFVVRVSNIEGQTSSLTDTATTLEAVPATSPAGLNVSSVSDISITVCWEELPCFDQNGHITGYSVRHGEVGTNISATINVPDGGGNHQTSISGLIPSTEYWIQVAAVNSAGTGDYSDFIVQETDGVDCGDPPGLINGRFTASFINTTYNSTVTYECIEGFNLHGADSRTCFASGNWSGEDSFCIT